MSETAAATSQSRGFPHSRETEIDGSNIDGSNSWQLWMVLALKLLAIGLICYFLVPA
jgi:hypothetical protein